jgi:hypothetical protein
MKPKWSFTAFQDWAISQRSAVPQSKPKCDTVVGAEIDGLPTFGILAVTPPRSG